MSVCSHRPLVELHFPLSEVWKLLEGIDGDQDWADVGLGRGAKSRTRTRNQTLAITARLASKKQLF